MFISSRFFPSPNWYFSCQFMLILKKQTSPQTNKNLTTRCAIRNVIFNFTLISLSPSICYVRVCVSMYYMYIIWCTINTTHAMEHDIYMRFNYFDVINHINCHLNWIYDIHIVCTFGHTHKQHMPIMIVALKTGWTLNMYT